MFEETEQPMDLEEGEIAEQAIQHPNVTDTLLAAFPTGGIVKADPRSDESDEEEEFVVPPPTPQARSVATTPLPQDDDFQICYENIVRMGSLNLSLSPVPVPSYSLQPQFQKVNWTLKFAVDPRKADTPVQYSDEPNLFQLNEDECFHAYIAETGQKLIVPRDCSRIRIDLVIPLPSCLNTWPKGFIQYYPAYLSLPGGYHLTFDRDMVLSNLDENEPEDRLQSWSLKVMDHDSNVMAWPDRCVHMLPSDLKKA